MAASPLRILLSNDDGFDATGLKLLERVARTISEDVWVVAPETEQSGAGHSLTLRRPLRIRHRAERHYSVDGTPTDCVLLAVKHILGDHPPDLVLAGINRGLTDRMCQSAQQGRDRQYETRSVTHAYSSVVLLHTIPEWVAPTEPVPWSSACRHHSGGPE